MKKTLVFLVLMLIIFIGGANAYASDDSYFEVTNDMMVIDPQVASGSSGISGRINTIRVIIPANAIERSEYEVRIKFELDRLHEVKIDSELPTRTNTAFSNAIKLVDEPNRHIFRVDILNNGNDGIIDFHIKDLKLPLNFSDYQVKLDVSVERSEILSDTTLSFANSTRIFYSIDTKYLMNPVANANMVSAGPFMFKQLRPGKPQNITMELPRGFYWDTTVQAVTVKPLSGFRDDSVQEIPVVYKDTLRTGDRGRQVEFLLEKLEDADEFVVSSFEIMGSYPETGLIIKLDPDESSVGSIVATASHTIPVNVDVGYYRNPRVEFRISDPSVVSWNHRIPLSGFAMVEHRAAELRPGDLLSLTLPIGAQWNSLQENAGSRPVSTPQLTGSTDTKNLQFEELNDRISWHFADSDQRTIFTRVSRQSGTQYLTEPAELVFSGSHVLLDEDFSGPLDITVAGSAAGRNGLTYTAAIIEPKDLQEEIIVDDPEGTVTEPTEMISFRLPIDSDFYEKDGSLFPYRVAPVIRDSRTFLGLRDVAEMIGVPGEMIQWNPEQENVMILQNGKQIRVEIGNADIQYDGMVERMDTVPFIHEGRTMLPISPLMKVLGIDYTWDAEANTIIFAR